MAKTGFKVPEPLLEELQLFLDSISLIIKENHTPSIEFRQLEAFLVEKATQDLSAESIH